jgi:hypothetical protein
VELVVEKAANVFFEFWKVEIVDKEGEGFGVSTNCVWLSGKPQQSKRIAERTRLVREPNISFTSDHPLSLYILTLFILFVIVIDWPLLLYCIGRCWFWF